MTNEQIKQIASEYSALLNEENYDNTLAKLAEKAFIDGANFANKHWQEKTRWISVTERLPELREKQYSIIAKDEEGEMFFHYIGLEIDIHYLGSVFTYWREIE